LGKSSTIIKENKKIAHREVQGFPMSWRGEESGSDDTAVRHYRFGFSVVIYFFFSLTFRFQFDYFLYFLYFCNHTNHFFTPNGPPKSPPPFLSSQSALLTRTYQGYNLSYSEKFTLPLDFSTGMVPVLLEVWVVL
jgi:hypothetical protein